MRFNREIRGSAAVSTHWLMEALEERTLFGGSPFPSLALLEDPTNPVVELTTERGNIFIELLANQAPLTVAAYLNVLDSRSATNQTFFSDVRPGVSLTGGTWYWFEPASPGDYGSDVLNQFGGDGLAGAGEGGRANAQRTIATTIFHYSPTPGSGLPQYLVFNLADNSATRDPHEFVVFARVVDDASWSVVLDITSLPPGNFGTAPNVYPGIEVYLPSVPLTHAYAPGDPASPDLVVHTWDTQLVKAQGAPDYYRHAIYSAEGFTGSTISEFIPIENPNAEPVYYEIRTRYERQPGSFRDTRDGIVVRGVIGAGSRGGYTMSTVATWMSANVYAGVPYALEVLSTLPVAASLSHYDFLIGTGESLVSTLATSWFFQEVIVNDRGTHDFLVWVNPSDQQGTVTVTFTADGGATLAPFVMPIDRFRRGGLNVLMAGVPVGHYAASVVSTVPVLASLSHYGLTALGPPVDGFATIGATGAASAVGVVPMAIQGGVGTFSFFNPGSSAAVVSVDLYEPGSATPVFSMTDAATVAPGERAELLVPGFSETLSAVYTSTQPIHASYSLLRNDDSYGSVVAVSAGNEFRFAEGFTDPTRTGPNLLEEHLTVFNPLGAALGLAVQDAQVTFTFRSTDGSSFSINQTVAGGTGAHLEISVLRQIIDRANDNGLFYYSVDVTSDVPIIAEFMHTDIHASGPNTRTGGFSLSGTNFGAVTRLDQLGG